MEQIYEADDQTFIISQDNSEGIGNNVFGNTNNEIPNYLYKYIEKLEQEIQQLKDEIKNLKG